MYTRVLTALLVMASGASLAQTKIEAFSCDTCDYQGAVDIAKKEALDLTCLPQAPSEHINGTTQTKLIEVCSATSKELVVANPVTRKAFKFKVVSKPKHATGRERIITVTDLTFNSTEHHILQDFYELDSDFRNAVTEVNTADKSHITSEPTALAAAKSQSSSSCDNHLLHIMGSPRLKDKMLDNLSRGIADKIGNKSWESVTSELRVNGFEVNVSRRGVTFAIKLSYHNNRVFVSHRIDRDNKLKFEVDYRGSEIHDGQREIDFGFRFMPDVSLVEGVYVSDLTRSGKINMQGKTFSECFTQYFIEKADETEMREVRGGGGTSPIGSHLGPIVQPGGGNLLSRMCRFKMKAQTSIVDLAVQTITWYAPCK